MSAEFNQPTASGHVYGEPSTAEGVERLSTDNAQGIIESWDDGECPPAPTWAMVNLMLVENRRQVHRVQRRDQTIIDMRKIIDAPDGGPPQWAEVAIGVGLAVMGYLIGVSR